MIRRARPSLHLIRRTNGQSCTYAIYICISGESDTIPEASIPCITLSSICHLGIDRYLYICYTRVPDPWRYRSRAIAQLEIHVYAWASIKLTLVIYCMGKGITPKRDRGRIVDETAWKESERGINVYVYEELRKKKCS